MRKNKKIPAYETTLIGGKFKGKRIAVPGIATTRSSKSILRESLFNTLQFDIVDRVFVEVFAGSGSIGLEALSRGAKRCIFMENDPVAQRFLKENIKKLDPARCETVFADSFLMFEKVHEQLAQSKQKCFFYFDPPFEIREGMEAVYTKTISLIETIDPAICEAAILEHRSAVDVPDTIAAFKKVKTRKFGKSALSYFKPSGAENE